MATQSIDREPGEGLARQEVEDEGGFVIAVTAPILVALVALIGLALDSGVAFKTNGDLQTVVDSAALKAVEAKMEGASKNAQRQRAREMSNQGSAPRVRREGDALGEIVGDGQQGTQE